MRGPSSERASWPAGGELGASIRAFDWSRTPLGPIERWPGSLRTAVDLVVGCGVPMLLAWGPELTQVYNDAFRDLMGEKHPAGLGQPARACCPELWHVYGPLYARVFRGEAVTLADAPSPVARSGIAEAGNVAPCFSPVRDETGAVAGALVTVVETAGRPRAGAEHRDAGEALRRSERWLSGIVETAAEGIVTIDPEGRFLGANPAAERILGVSQAELRGRSSAAPPFRRYTLAGEPLGENPTPAEVGAAGDRVFHDEYLIERADGSRVAIARDVTALRDEDGAFLGVVSTFSEITARLHAGATLRESEARFRGLAESVPLMVWTSTDTTVDYFNQRWFEYTGLAPGAGVGEAWQGIVHPDDLAEAVRRSKESSRTGAVYEMEFRLRRADGAYRWHIARALRIPETGRWIGTATDIHDFKETEAALRRSEEQVRALLANLPGGAAFVVDRDLRYLLVGGEALRPAGFEAADLVGRTIFEVLDAERVASSEQTYRQALAGEPFAKEHEAHGRVYLTRGVPLRDESGAIYAALAVSYDITDRKQVEAALEQSRRESEARVVERTIDLARANARLRAEVSERRRSERARTDLLRRLVVAQEEERRRMAREVHDGVTQLAAAAALHLDEAISLLPELDGTVRAELERAGALARESAAEARRLIAALRPEALDDFGIGGALRQEVETLKLSGWRATFEDGGVAGGRLSPEAEITLFRVAQEALLNVRKHTRPTRVQVRLARRGGHVRLQVRDWGGGFDPERARDGAAPGERVGLTGMRERLALFGGRLDLRSGPGRGTTIRATLPLAEGS